MVCPSQHSYSALQVDERSHYRGHSIKGMESISDDEEFPLSQDEVTQLLALEIPSSGNKKRKVENEGAYPPTVKRPSIQTYPTTSKAAVEVLRRTFGMSSFRLKQEAAIARILAGGSCCVIFPTGGGKSLIFQIPALLFEDQDKLENKRSIGEHGITLVVSPLIALMKDQVDALRRKGIQARCLDSTKSREEVFETHEMMENGTLKLLYCAPERLNNEGFVSRIMSVRGGVRLLAVDESHCISEWGQSFRPDYLKIARFADEVRAERVVCLTATATPRVAEDICKAFKIDKGGLFRTSTYRSNLQILAETGRTKQELYPRLFSFLKQNPGPSIVYVTLQKQTELLAGDLQDQGFNAEAFHAGLNAGTKTALQEKFMKSDDLIVVATIAFGMGIDKENVRNVVHFNIPSSIESYSQEIGRAGRDGKLSKCLFYVCGEDYYLRENFARGEMCSRESVRGLLEEIFTDGRALRVNDILKASQYQQCREWDIRQTTLSNIYAQLELSHDLLRAVTPEYSKYEYSEGDQYYYKTKSDNSPAAEAIKSTAIRTTGRTKIKYSVDVEGAARAFSSQGVTRFDVVRKLNDWNDNQVIVLTVAGVINCYRILQKLPDTPIATNMLADELYELMGKREQEAVDRTDAILNLITSPQCFAKSLAQHFGDDLPGNAAECGHCSYCMTHKQVLPQDPPPVPFNQATFKKILNDIDDRDDPRFLTRVAFGITSPRITAMKLKRGDRSIFGSMEDHKFMELLDAFTAECSKSPKEHSKPIPTPPPRVKSNYKKATSSKSTSSRGYSISSKGSSHRGRNNRGYGK